MALDKKPDNLSLNSIVSPPVISKVCSLSSIDYLANGEGGGIRTHRYTD